MKEFECFFVKLYIAKTVIEIKENIEINTEISLFTGESSPYIAFWTLL